DDELIDPQRRVDGGTADREDADAQVALAQQFRQGGQAGTGGDATIADDDQVIAATWVSQALEFIAQRTAAARSGGEFADQADGIDGFVTAADGAPFLEEMAAGGQGLERD